MFFRRKRKQSYSKDRNLRKLQKKFYADYPEIPFMKSYDDSRKKWIDMIPMFSDEALVKKEMMIRNKDGLLPGHVFQIYWVNKYNENRRVPEYFEYEYGIDFYAELEFLEKEGYISNFSATNKGNLIIDKYSQIINEKLNKNRGIVKIDRKKEMKRYKEEMKRYKEMGIKSNETLKQKEGYLDQTEGINYYKLKDFDKAEKYLLSALSKDFASPGGIMYLAKIYRKRKEYDREINILRRGGEMLIKNKEWNELSEEFLYRIERAQALMDKDNK